MRANYKVEFASGVFLLLGLAALLWLSTQATDYGSRLGEETYGISARFTNVADLKATIAGQNWWRCGGCRGGH